MYLIIGAVTRMGRGFTRRRVPLIGKTCRVLTPGTMRHPQLTICSLLASRYERCCACLPNIIPTCLVALHAAVRPPAQPRLVYTLLLSGAKADTVSTGEYFSAALHDAGCNVVMTACCWPLVPTEMQRTPKAIPHLRVSCSTKPRAAGSLGPHVTVTRWRRSVSCTGLLCFGYCCTFNTAWYTVNACTSASHQH